MHALNPESLKALAERAIPPCLSVYQTTHRSHPDKQQDRMVFRGHVKSLAASLAQAHIRADVPALLAPFHALADNDAFWNHTLDGLAVLGCSGVFRVFVLPRILPDMAVVADSFHTQPLRRTLQSVDRYQVLCLSRDKAKLWEGNRDGLVEIELPASVPQSASAALGDQFTEPHQTVSSMGGIGQGTGRLQADSGRVAHADLQDPTVDDVLDDLGELVERMGGVVHALSASQMPTTSGLAATFRH